MQSNFQPANQIADGASSHNVTRPGLQAEVMIDTTSGSAPANQSIAQQPVQPALRLSETDQLMRDIIAVADQENDYEFIGSLNAYRSLVSCRRRREEKLHCKQVGHGMNPLLQNPVQSSSAVLGKRSLTTQDFPTVPTTLPRHAELQPRPAQEEEEKQQPVSETALISQRLTAELVKQEEAYLLNKKLTEERDKHLSALLSCQICYSVYDKTEKRPVSLQCGHTFCAFCCIKWTSLSGRSKSISCPLDRKLTQIPASGLPTNYQVFELVEQVMPSKPAAIPAIVFDDDDVQFVEDSNGEPERRAVARDPRLDALLASLKSSLITVHGQLEFPAGGVCDLAAVEAVVLMMQQQSDGKTKVMFQTYVQQMLMGLSARTYNGRLASEMRGLDTVVVVCKTDDGYWSLLVLNQDLDDPACPGPRTLLHLDYKDREIPANVLTLGKLLSKIKWGVGMTPKKPTSLFVPRYLAKDNSSFQAIEYIIRLLTDKKPLLKALLEKLSDSPAFRSIDVFHLKDKLASFFNISHNTSAEAKDAFFAFVLTHYQ